MLARLFFKEKMSRYCHHSGVVVGSIVVVVLVVLMTNFNLGYSFKSAEANIMELHTLVNHHQGSAEDLKKRGEFSHRP